MVEDNDDVGQFSTELLEDLGYTVRRVDNADAALAILAEDEFAADLVFSDVIMPGMNGVELAGVIRERYPGLPVVLTSGYSNVLAENAHRGFELIQKPYSVEVAVADSPEGDFRRAAVGHSHSLPRHPAWCELLRVLEGWAAGRFASFERAQDAQLKHLYDGRRFLILINLRLIDSIAMSTFTTKTASRASARLTLRYSGHDPMRTSALIA